MTNRTDCETELHTKTLKLGARIGDLEANALAVIWQFDALPKATRDELPDDFTRQIADLRAAMETGDWSDWRQQHA